ncbi:metallophosphoesterase [Opitutus sp. ER46]|nr:metallophosphoesterase [Opitutus sp. ER46]
MVAGMRRLNLFPLLLALLTLGVTPGRAADFSFAWLTDTHVGGRTGAEDLAAAVRDINAMPDLAFVIVSGDVTDLGTLAELTRAREILGGLRVPLHIIPGNHDCKWSESGATDFPRVFGADRFAFTHAGIRFIGLHEGPVLRMGNGHFAPQDLRWLDETLARDAAKGEPVVFVTHYPLDPDITNWFEVLDRLKRVNTQAALFGHGHANRVFDHEGVPGVMARSNLRATAPVGAFTIVRVSADRMTFAVHPHGGATAAPWHEVALRDRRAEFAGAPQTPRPRFGFAQNYPPLRRRWQQDTGWTIVSSPVVWRDHAIIGDASGAVRSFALADGAPAWTFQTGGAVHSTPCVAGDTVVVASTDGSVYALKAADGTVRWQFKTARPIVACPQVADDVVYIGSSEGRFRALGLADGKLRWEHAGGQGYIETRPLIHDGRVYFGAWDRTFYALDAKTGAEAWTWKVARESRFYSPAACWPVAAEGKVFIVNPEQKVIALDARTGAEVWQVKEPYSARESIGISADGQRVYVGAMRQFIRAYRTASAKPELVWETDAEYGADFNTAMLTERDDTVYYGTKTGILLALDAKTGAIRWKYRLAVAALNTPCPLANGAVLLTDQAGHVAVIEPR